MMNYKRKLETQAQRINLRVIEEEFAIFIKHFDKHSHLTKGNRVCAACFFLTPWYTPVYYEQFNLLKK